MIVEFYFALVAGGAASAAYYSGVFTFAAT